MAKLPAKIRKPLAYIASLPERLLRSLAALLGGGSLLLSDTLLPESLRQTTMFKVFFGNMQQFLLTKVALAGEDTATDNNPTAGSAAAAAPVAGAVTTAGATANAGDNFVPRKLLGNALEAAGLLAVRFSPLWVFAIAGDAAAGSKTFLLRLVNHLKANDVLPSDVNPDNLTDLLDALQSVTSQSAQAIDMPPLSRQQLTSLADNLRQSYGNMFSKSAALLPRLDDLWAQMEETARTQNVSFEELGGILTAGAADLTKKSFRTVWALGRTSGELIGENILNSYARTMDNIAREGVDRYIAKRMKPYLRLAAEHFAPGRGTWTEGKLNP